MLIRLFKGLVFMAGAALLLRAGHRRFSSGEGGEEEVEIEPMGLPVNVRMERIELRLADLESPSEATTPTQESGSPDMAELRDLIEAVDRRNGEQITAMSLRMDDLQNHLPQFIDIKVTAKVNELEERLKLEIAESSAQAVRELSETFEGRMLQAMSGIEASLVDHGRQIVDLRDRIGRTDQSVAKILATVEKLTGSPEARFALYANGESAVNGH